MVRVFRVVHVTYEDDAERVGAQTSTPLMPDLVLDLLAAYLDANRVPFRYTVSSKYDQHIPDVCDHTCELVPRQTIVGRIGTAISSSKDYC